MQDLLNMVDEVEQSHPKPNIFPVWFLLIVALSYLGEAQRFTFWRVQVVFMNNMLSV